MFENNTYELLLDRKLARVKSNIDKNEGSLIYNTLAPNAWELSQAYIDIDQVYDTTFADTAPREELIRRAKERGLKVKQATHAILKANFNIEVELGTRFSADELSYIVTDKIDKGIYKIKCETAGTAGNKKFGTIMAIEYIEGLLSAEITELLIPAEDEEETENFRERYFASFDSQAFGGNKADYIQKTENIQGVGRIKCYRVNKEKNHITIQIINSEYTIPSTELIKEVQTILDPVRNQGDGDGLAPIGHIVDVEGVVGKTIDITASLTLKADYIWEDISDNVKSCIDKYFLDLAKEWANLDNIIIRVSQLESKILSVAGIEDIKNTSINSTQNNLILESNEIPLRGIICAN